MLKAVTAPGPSLVASEVSTTNVICDTPRPSARGPIRVIALRVGGSLTSIVARWR